ncbi:hypothetical protein CBL_09391 [Carabus blaptoides fortunei]
MPSLHKCRSAYIFNSSGFASVSRSLFTCDHTNWNNDNINQIFNIYLLKSFLQHH